MVNIIVRKSYEHVNSALGNWDTPTGKYIKNKRHYYDELKRQHMLPQEKAERASDKISLNNTKDYKLSMDTHNFLQTVKNSAKKNGKVHLSDRAIKKMIDMGAIGKQVDLAKLPAHYQKGGFN